MPIVLLPGQRSQEGSSVDLSSRWTCILHAQESVPPRHPRQEVVRGPSRTPPRILQARGIVRRRDLPLQSVQTGTTRTGQGLREPSEESSSEVQFRRAQRPSSEGPISRRAPGQRHEERNPSKTVHRYLIFQGRHCYRHCQRDCNEGGCSVHARSFCLERVERQRSPVKRSSPQTGPCNICAGKSINCCTRTASCR